MQVPEDVGTGVSGVTSAALVCGWVALVVAAAADDVGVGGVVGGLVEGAGVDVGRGSAVVLRVVGVLGGGVEGAGVDVSSAAAGVVHSGEGVVVT